MITRKRRRKLSGRRRKPLGVADKREVRSEATAGAELQRDPAKGHVGHRGVRRGLRPLGQGCRLGAGGAWVLVFPAPAGLVPAALLLSPPAPGKALGVGRPPVLPRVPARQTAVAAGVVHTADEHAGLVVRSRELALGQGLGQVRQGVLASSLVAVETVL